MVDNPQPGSRKMITFAAPVRLAANLDLFEGDWREGNATYGRAHPRGVLPWLFLDGARVSRNLA